MEHFFSPNSSGDLRSDAHQSQIIGGDADVDHTQIIGGGYRQIIGGIYPPGFGTPVFHILFHVIITNELPVTFLQTYVSLPRHIRKGVLKRQIIASDAYCSR